jgi:uncharacterized tellurite resistance protein B-like protein
MELTDLDENEQAAMVALLDRVIAADRELSDDEEKHLRNVIEAFGPERYARAVEHVDEAIEEDADLERLLESITRQDARELIYATIMDVALADAVMPQEAPLLERLAARWGIEVKPG